MSLSAELIHSIPVDESTGAISVPIYQTTTFVHSSPGVHQGYDYTRSGNPTRKVLEDLMVEKIQKMSLIIATMLFKQVISLTTTFRSAVEIPELTS